MSAESAESLLFRAHDVSHHCKSPDNGTFLNYDLFRGSVRCNPSCCVSVLVEGTGESLGRSGHDGGFVSLAAFRYLFSGFFVFETFETAP